MMYNERKIDELTTDYIKKSGWEEPSGNFTELVMASVMLKTHRMEKRWPALLRWMNLYGGLLLDLFAGTVLSWFLVDKYNLMIYVKPVIEFFSPIYSVIINLFKSLKLIPFSSGLFISFTAILLLLTVEEFFSISKRTFSQKDR